MTDKSIRDYAVVPTKQENIMQTLNEIYDTFTPGSKGFCVAVETNCGYDISRVEIARIAGQAATAEEFDEIWKNEDWWVE